MIHLNLHVKQFVVRVLLAILRSLIVLKRVVGSWLDKSWTPLTAIGLFFVRRFYVPIYRWILIARRYIQKVLLPAKHRVVYVISNRYTIHVLMILIVGSVTWVNLSAREVRAEDFGQRSLLYQMVAEDDASILEVVEAGSAVINLGAPTSYVRGTVVDARRHVDLDFLEETATPVVGVPEEVETAPETVPARTEVQTYVVQDGDTLGRIAERFGLSLSTILWSNSLTYRSTIRPGQELNILPEDGILYTVKSGDTLSRIARSYDVDVQDIMSENGLTSAHKLSIGDELLLPGGEPPTPSTSTTSSTRSTASITQIFKAPPVTAPSPAVDGWVWPTDWRVITQYYGWRHTGIDVDGDYGTNSYAARGGVVIYSGWRTGYGVTVEIDHGDGYMTRYAHHAKNYVSVGDVVSTGQAIAQTGTTGRSTGTHLHFEIIRNGKFLNPLDFVR